MTNKRIKILVLGYEALTQRRLTDMCLDELAEVFDVEYWNCNSLVIPSVPDKSKSISRPYCYSIKSYTDLKNNLSRLPSNTIAIRSIFLNADMFKFYKLVASKVPCLVDFFLNRNMLSAPQEGKKDISNVDGITNASFSLIMESIKKMKHRLYKNERLLLFLAYLRYHGDNRYFNLRNKLYLA